MPYVDPEKDEAADLVLAFEFACTRCGAGFTVDSESSVEGCVMCKTHEEHAHLRCDNCFHEGIWIGLKVKLVEKAEADEDARTTHKPIHRGA